MQHSAPPCLVQFPRVVAPAHNTADDKCNEKPEPMVLPQDGRIVPIQKLIHDVLLFHNGKFNAAIFSARIIGMSGIKRLACAIADC